MPLMSCYTCWRLCRVVLPGRRPESSGALRFALSCMQSKMKSAHARVPQPLKLLDDIYIVAFSTPFPGLDNARRHGMTVASKFFRRMDGGAALPWNEL